MKKFLLLMTLIFVVGCSSQSEQEPTLSSGEASLPKAESTKKDPWILQDRCLEHPDDCTKYDVYNQTKSWLQVNLENTETGESGFFTIRKKTTAQITLVPGQYQTTFTWWCDSKEKTTTEIMAVGRWKDFVRCPQGYYKRVKK
jgi:hypothetical protein